jgi:glycosyltransferase involved in cell wall biosynthesis
LYLGRLSPEKGTDTLCKTWRHLAPRLADAQLVVVGDGPDRPLVEELIATAGENRVRFLGFREQVKPYIRAADVLLLPSRTEGMPNAVVEAAACGVPTVATNTRGAQEVIVNGQTGVLVAEEDAQALATEVERLLRDGEARARMGGQARELALSTWSVESTFSILAKAYGNATGGRLQLADFR